MTMTAYHWAHWSPETRSEVLQEMCRNSQKADLLQNSTCKI